MKNLAFVCGMFACFILGYVYHFYQVEQAVNLIQTEKKYLECRQESLMDKIGWLEADRAILFNELSPLQRKIIRRKIERR